MPVNAPQRPPQRPLELILARNFLSSVSTAAFLVDGEGMIVFYNEAAGDLLGPRFEEAGRSARRTGARATARSTTTARRSRSRSWT